MFARYEYKAGATVANIIADVVALLTGETNPANLSSDCVVATSYVISTVAAGWTLFDNAAGTNKKTLRAPNADGSYKYVVLDAALNAGRLTLDGFESWNATTHVGTNSCYYGSSNYQPTINTATGGVLMIGSKAQYLFMTAYVLGAWDYTNRLIGERQRIEPWDTTAGGPPLIVASSDYSWNTFYAPRLKNVIVGSGDLTSSNAILSTFSAYGSLDFKTGRAADGTSIVHKASPVYVSANQTNQAAMAAGVLQGGIQVTSAGFGLMGDELSIGGVTHFIVASQSGSNGRRFALPKV